MKEYIIEAIVKDVGMYLDHPNSQIHDINYPFDQIADMLRYDAGRVQEMKRVEDTMVFIIKSKRYTLRRWASFGIETKEVK